MDSGYLAPGETFQDEYDVIRTLLPEEVIGIMDQLLCHEVRYQPLPLNVTKSLGTDLIIRWHGIWAVHSRKLCSLLSTWTIYYRLSPRH